MARLSLAALLLAVACQSGGAGEGELAELREEHDGEVADLRNELRDLRAELRDLRAELRDLRALAGPATDGALSLEPPEPDAAASTEDAPDGPEEVPAGEPSQKEEVRIAVSSNPSGATVFLGGTDLGVTPLLLQRQPGSEEITLRIEKPGYRARLMTVRPEDDTKLSVQLARK